MSRRSTFTAEMPGQDSFLDVVANMVGIMIILVMVVGVRASRTPYDLPPAEIRAEDALGELAQRQTESAALQSEVLQLERHGKELAATIAARSLEREKAALLAAAMEEELAQLRGQLDAGSQVDFDLRKAFAEARAQLEAVNQQRAAIDAAPADVVKIQSLPTPITKTVHGKELHFQLRAGRVTFVPFEELLETFRTTAKHKVWKLDEQSQMVDIVGPIDGFRMRYELGRFEIPPELARETGRGGSVIRLVKFEILPVSLNQGETCEEALSPHSAFREKLARHEPGRTSITIWTYPDSFDGFRKLKAELHALGFPTAGRPLPLDHPIGGSPEGSRSSAQ